jgi:hypothetical protein
MYSYKVKVDRTIYPLFVWLGSFLVGDLILWGLFELLALTEIGGVHFLLFLLMCLTVAVFIVMTIGLLEGLWGAIEYVGETTCKLYLIQERGSFVIEKHIEGEIEVLKRFEYNWRDTDVKKSDVEAKARVWIRDYYEDNLTERKIL